MLDEQTSNAIRALHTTFVEARVKLTIVCKAVAADKPLSMCFLFVSTNLYSKSRHALLPRWAKDILDPTFLYQFRLHSSLCTSRQSTGRTALQLSLSWIITHRERAGCLRYQYEVHTYLDRSSNLLLPTCVRFYKFKRLGKIGFHCYFCCHALFVVGMT